MQQIAENKPNEPSLSQLFRGCVYSYLTLQEIGQKIACLNSSEYEFLRSSHLFKDFGRALELKLEGKEINLKSLRLFANLCSHLRPIIIKPTGQDLILYEFICEYHFDKLKNSGITIPSNGAIPAQTYSQLVKLFKKYK